MTVWPRALSVLPLMLFAVGTAVAGSSTPLSNAAAQLVPSAPEKSEPILASDINPESDAMPLSKSVAQAPANVYSWDMILEKYLAPVDAIGLARFNYGALHANSNDRAALTQYVSSLEEVNVEPLSEKAAAAYWANLYNAVTIKVVIDNYPVESIRDIKSGFRSGPWKRNLVEVGGKKLSLDDIEHKILRKRHSSPLIHYMVNCASVGCPNLKATPWQAETLDADRDAAARDFINSTRGVRITKGGLKVSSIYKWFEEDFGGNKDGVLAHLREYADADLAAAIDNGAKIEGYGYSWSLNK